MDFLNKKYMACYLRTNSGGNMWNCKCGFKSYPEADEYSRTNHTKEKIPELQATKLLSVSNVWPNFMKEQIISYELSPRVEIKQQPKV